MGGINAPLTPPLPYLDSETASDPEPMLRGWDLGHLGNREVFSSPWSTNTVPFTLQST